MPRNPSVAPPELRERGAIRADVALLAAVLVMVAGFVGVVAIVLSGGNDGKSFARLGVTAYGFSPLRLPADLDFGALFHGVDERVPIESVHFGVRALDRFLRQV